MGPAACAERLALLNRWGHPPPPTEGPPALSQPTLVLLLANSDHFPPALENPRGWRTLGSPDITYWGGGCFLSTIKNQDRLFFLLDIYFLLLFPEKSPNSLLSGSNGRELFTYLSFLTKERLFSQSAGGLSPIFLTLPTPPSDLVQKEKFPGVNKIQSEKKRENQAEQPCAHHTLLLPPATRNLPHPQLRG